LSTVSARARRCVRTLGVQACLHGVLWAGAQLGVCQVGAWTRCCQMRARFYVWPLRGSKTPSRVSFQSWLICVMVVTGSGKRSLARLALPGRSRVFRPLPYKGPEIVGARPWKLSGRGHLVPTPWSQGPGLALGADDRLVIVGPWPRNLLFAQREAAGDAEAIPWCLGVSRRVVGLMGLVCSRARKVASWSCVAPAFKGILW